MKNKCLSLEQFLTAMKPIVNTCAREMSEGQLQAYYELLNDIPIDVLMDAVRRALLESESTFVPAVGLLRRFAAEAIYGTLPTWGAEWERVNIAIRQFGRDKGKDAAEFLGPFTAAIVRQLNWRAICESEAIGVQMSLFRSLYEEAVRVEMNNRRLSEDLRPVVNSSRVVFTQESKRLAVNK